MNWWRVELDATGAILKCDSVEKREAGNKYIRYVEAASAAEAVKGAKLWWSGWQEYLLSMKSPTYEARRLANQCVVCASPLEPFLKQRAGRPAGEVFESVSPKGRRCNECHALGEHEKQQRYAASKKTAPVLAQEKLAVVHRAPPQLKPKFDRGILGTSRRAELLLAQFQLLGPQKFLAWLEAEVSRLARAAA